MQDLLVPRDATETARQGQGIGDIEAMKQMATKAVPEILRMAPGTSTGMSILDAAVAAAQRDYGGAGMAALGAVPFAGTVKAVKPLASLIKDWRWRPSAEVVEQLGIKELPEHVLPFGNFMRKQADRAVQSGLTPRDVAKANIITQASIQRSAIDPNKLREVGFDLPESVGESIRPEGAMAEMLMTPLGKKYLDQVEEGVIDPAVIEQIVTRMKPFGKDNDLRDKLARNLEVSRLNNEFTEIVGNAAQGREQLAREQMQALTGQMHGTGPSKRGFVGSLVGYGVDPTFDARQIVLHTGRPSKEAQPFLRRSSGRGAVAAVDRLTRRQEAMNVAVPESLRPFRQHLVHHSVWDKVAGDATTHSDLIKAMLTAGVAGGVGLKAYGEQSREPDA
jgi:hypothetical protein